MLEIGDNMIRSDNEWSRLKRVILGSAENFNFPKNDPEYSTWDEAPIGPASPIAIHETQEALNLFQAELENLGVEVIRPKPIDYVKEDGFGCYCPRDTTLVIGDKVILTPTVWPNRRIEWKAIRAALGDNVTTVDDPAAVFDAANIIRCGKDILYLISYSGNEAGADWLENYLGPEYIVHRLNAVYQGMHLDSTIVPLRDGLVMLNSERIKEYQLPDFMKSWDKIWIKQEDLIQPKGWDHMTSNWIGMNVLSYDENTIFCDSNQTILRKKFDKYGIETIGVNLPHAKMFMGGHHCVTLDLQRL